ncbi:hypothetical protein ACH34W_46830 [Actinomadura sp. 6N118]
MLQAGDSLHELRSLPAQVIALVSVRVGQDPADLGEPKLKFLVDEEPVKPGDVVAG